MLYCPPYQRYRCGFLLLVLLLTSCGVVPSRPDVPQSTMSAPQVTPSAAATAPPSPALVETPPATTATPDATGDDRGDGLDRAGLGARLAAEIRAGTPVVDIPEPGLPVPDSVFRWQIAQAFQVGTLMIGLVRQPSVNVILDGPVGEPVAFAGLVVSEAGAAWQPYIALRDAAGDAKPNPYHLWVEDSQLYLSVVDQLGAGSGEGYLTLLRLSASGTWEAVGCFYFGASYGGPERDGDYFRFSQRRDQQRPEPQARCEGATLELLP